MLCGDFSAVRTEAASGSVNVDVVAMCEWKGVEFVPSDGSVFAWCQSVIILLACWKVGRLLGVMVYSTPIDPAGPR